MKQAFKEMPQFVDFFIPRKGEGSLCPSMDANPSACSSLQTDDYTPDQNATVPVSETIQ
jgi:hypothetical protein